MKKYNREKGDEKRMNRDFKHKHRRPRRSSAYVGRGVVLQEGESVEQLIRRFKKVVEASGVMRELKRREFYLSPAQKNREKKKRAAKKARKRNRFPDSLVDNDKAE